MNVHLRQRKQTKTGKISLYLEFYKGNKISNDGKTKILREYEYLKIYLFDNPKDKMETDYNEEQFIRANYIRNERENAITDGTYSIKIKSNKNLDLFEYIKRILTTKSIDNTNNQIDNSTIRHLKIFTNNKNLALNDIDKNFFEDFKNYLLYTAKKNNGLPLSEHTAHQYFSKLKFFIHQAVNDNLIPLATYKGIKFKKIQENERNFLTLDEVKALVKTDCKNSILKRAFLFSCLTGLRWSDIYNLKWSEVQKINDYWRLTFNQQKTKGLMYLDISEQAREYLGEPSNHNELVFEGLKYHPQMHYDLERWINNAGIKKRITFHCARHTFAVLQLTFGTDIFTLSKLLGHTDIKTTQVYAKIIDEKKREAVNKIPNINF
ncbi:MAG: site-specific integrase [Candidatus Kapabacteria bacterium]|nr:site-specific integrase [Candidatus Kapabacteria bacterium]